MKKFSLSAIAKAMTAAAKPAAIGGGVFLVGAANAQIGSAIAKRAIPQVDAFAAKSAINEALVDAVASLPLNAAVMAAAAAWKGPKVLAPVGAVLMMGSAASAAAPVVAPKVAQLADKAVGLLFPASAPSAAPGGYVQSQALGGLLPGGYVQSQDLGGTLPGGYVSSQDLGGTLPGGDVVSVTGIGGTI